VYQRLSPEYGEDIPRLGGRPLRRDRKSDVWSWGGLVGRRDLLTTEPTVGLNYLTLGGAVGGRGGSTASRIVGNRICQIALLVLTVVGSAANRAPVAAQTTELTVSSEDDPARQDAQAAAELLGITPEEAYTRLSWQDQMGEVSADLAAGMPGRFGGLWIQHQPEYRIIVGLTDGDLGTVAPYFDGREFAHHVRVARADYSLSYLTLSAHSYLASHRSDRFDLRIDEPRSRVIVTYPQSAPSGSADGRRSRSDSRPRVRRGSMPEAFVLRFGELGHPAEPELYGGFAVVQTGGGSSCTAGFSVLSPAPVAGNATAGHCPNRLTFSGVDMNFVESDQSGSQDVQWSNSWAIIFRPWVRDESPDGHREIQSWKQASEINNGDIVCKYGKTTKFDCGEVTNRFFAPNWVTNPNPTFLIVDGAADMSEPGDSGGPVFHSMRAWAMISGSRDVSGEGIYMPIQYMWYQSSLDVSLKLAS
jgi:streptogrisin C